MLLNIRSPKLHIVKPIAFQYLLSNIISNKLTQLSNNNSNPSSINKTRLNYSTKKSCNKNKHYYENSLSLLNIHTPKYYFSGTQTNFLQSKMLKFQPYDQTHLNQLLIDLYKMRQYIPFQTPTFNHFISTIQKYYFRQQKFDKKMIKNYYLLEKMDMLSDSLKEILHKNVCGYLEREQGREGVRNQKLEAMLWWLWREFPYKFDRFQAIASQYTLQLYQLYQYFHSLPKLPSWQPYIRVTHMLKLLGHQIQCRQDMLNIQTLETVNRFYLPIIPQLFPPQKYQQLSQKNDYHTHMLSHFCDKYLLSDQMDYDKYLQRIELIDNISANQEINRTMDTISWVDLAEGWKGLALNTCKYHGLTEGQSHKFSEIFWRRLETNDIPIQQITSLLQMFTSVPGFLFQKRQTIIMRMLQSLYNKTQQDIQFFPPKGYLLLLKQTQFLPIDGDSVKKLNKFLLQKLPCLLTWQQGDAEQVLNLMDTKFNHQSPQLKTIQIWKAKQFLLKKVNKNKQINKNKK